MTTAAWRRKRRRAESIKTRAASGRADHIACRVIGCPRPTRSAAGKGVSRLYCRRHEDHFQRHGSYHKRSYSGAQLAPYRRAAQAWLKANAEKPAIRHAVQRADNLLRNAGAAEAAFRLRGLSPAGRARVAWARVRDAAGDPNKVLAAWLAVELILQDDPQPEHRPEFKRVQAAKIVHRMASGTHKRWERPKPDGGIVVDELHKYPASRGRVLRHMGEALQRAAEILVDRHLADIRGSAEHKRARLRPLWSQNQSKL